MEPGGTTMQAELVPAGTKCRSCGYPLDGLRFGQKCSECGAPIRRFRTTGELPLKDAPDRFLRTMHHAAVVVALCSLGSLAAFYVANSALVAGNPGSTRAALASLVGAVLAAAFTAGLTVLIQPRPTASGGTMKNLRAVRIAAILTQIAWPLCGLAMFGEAVFSGTLQGLAALAGLVFTLIGSLGFIPVSICLADLADWTNDESLADRLRACAWVATISALINLAFVVMSLTSFLIVGVLGLASILTSLFYLMAIVVFLVGLVQLARNTSWAVHNRAHAEAKAQRDMLRAEQRAAEEAEDLRRSTEAMAAVQPPASVPHAGDIPLADGPAPGAPRPGANTHRIERSQISDPFELMPEDDEEPRRP